MEVTHISKLIRPVSRLGYNSTFANEHTTNGDFVGCQGFLSLYNCPVQSLIQSKDIPFSEPQSSIVGEHLRYQWPLSLGQDIRE